MFSIGTSSSLATCVGFYYNNYNHHVTQCDAIVFVVAIEFDQSERKKQNKTNQSKMKMEQ